MATPSIIVTGIDTSGDDEASGHVSVLVETLLQRNPRPMVVCPRDAGSGSQTLVGSAIANDVGMIVAGAHGHLAWREWLLGSTMKSLLHACPVPVFIRHL